MVLPNKVDDRRIRELNRAHKVLEVAQKDALRGLRVRKAQMHNYEKSLAIAIAHQEAVEVRTKAFLDANVPACSDTFHFPEDADEIRAMSPIQQLALIIEDIQFIVDMQGAWDRRFQDRKGLFTIPNFDELVPGVYGSIGDLGEAVALQNAHNQAVHAVEILTRDVENLKLVVKRYEDNICGSLKLEGEEEVVMIDNHRLASEQQ